MPNSDDEIMWASERVLETLRHSGYSVADALKILGVAVGRILFVTGAGEEALMVEGTTNQGTFTMRAGLIKATYTEGRQ